MQQLLYKLKNVFYLCKYSLNRLPYEPLWMFNIENSSLLPATTAGSLQPMSIHELMQDGLLWGVPKKRPTIERRLKKRFGVPGYPQNTKLIRPRSDLVICERCGDHHEVHTICRTCYLEVKEETEKLKQEIKSQTKPLEPKEKEVLLKFSDEEVNQQDDARFHIVEIDRPRPNWFTKNLLAKAARPVSTPKDIILNSQENIESSKHE